MSLIDLENQQYRRDVLQLLEQDGDYAMSLAVLSQALAAIGNPIAHDRLHTQLHWLQDQGLVTLHDLSNKAVSAKLTPLGFDVALGRAFVPHIARLRLD